MPEPALVYILIQGEYSDQEIVGIFDASCGEQLLKRFPETNEYGAIHVETIRMNNGAGYIQQGRFPYYVEMVFADGGDAVAYEKFDDACGCEPEIRLFARHTRSFDDPGFKDDPMVGMIQLWPVWATDAADAIAKAETMRRSYTPPEEK